MGVLTVIWWRDIPAQVVAKDGRRASKIVLHPRFQTAIDRAPRRAGRRSMDEYIAEWHRSSGPAATTSRPRRPPRSPASKRRTRGTSSPTSSDRRRRGSGRTVDREPAAPAATTAAKPAAGARLTLTVVSSPTREVVIGFDRPFMIIGERINPTGRKLLAEEMKAGDFSRVERDALAQVEAGAHMLDVNAGIPLADEPAILAKTIQLVQSLDDVPLSIDSSIVEALEAGSRCTRASRS